MSIDEPEETRPKSLAFPLLDGANCRRDAGGRLRQAPYDSRHENARLA
jgi:hypothetical protein